MDIGVIFEYNNVLYQLPVNPAEISVKQDADNEDNSVVNLGQVTSIGSPKLKTLEINSFFAWDINAPYVETKNSGVSIIGGGTVIHSFKKPSEYVNFFRKIQSGKKPCRIIVTNRGINLLVTIESFQHTIEGGTHDRRYVLSLREYRVHNERVVKKKVTTKKSTTTKTTTKTQTTTVKKKTTKTTFSVGDKVTVNGVFRYDSYGAKPHGKASARKGKIGRIIAKPKSGQKYPYHIVTDSGGWLGWVKKSEIKHR